MHKSVLRDDAQTSQNKGKTRVLTYTAQRFKKMGLPCEYWGRVLSPLGAHFSFETIETPITITPLSQIPNVEVQKVVALLAEKGSIQEQRCYRNAIIIARELGRMGIAVRCVEGYYNVCGRWCKHRFNEIGGLYFDATAEYFLPVSREYIRYLGVRLYSADELIGVSAAMGALVNSTPYRFHICSTLPFNPSYEGGYDEGNEYCLNNDGVLCKNIVHFAA